MAEFQTTLLYVTLFISLFFEVFLLITYFEIRGDVRREKEFDSAKLTNFPSVSIIVPCFNEERTLASTVRSILNLDYPREKLSVILVDDGSTDGTPQTMKKFRNHSQVRVFRKENGGKHTALNLALEHIDTELVGCLDADSFVQPDALRRIVPYFENEEIMAVTPSVKIHEPRTVLQYVQKLEYSWGIFFRRMLASINGLYVTPGPFSIFRARVFKELGGYTLAHHTEDMEYAMRMQKHGYKIANSHMAHVYTVAPAKFNNLYKQRVRWTYGFLNNAIDYREMFFNRKYGHVGVFVLPFATLSIFTTLFGASNLVFRMGQKFTDFFSKFRTVGIKWEFSPSFDWYFVNTSVATLLTFTAIIAMIVIWVISLRMAEGRFRFGRELIYYPLIYTLIVPTWCAKALWNTLLRKTVSWR